jgi:fructose-1,6-bisphosphatase/inositol monophosphatase family enzyme
VVCTYVQPERPALLDGVRAIAAAGAQVRSFGTGSLELAWVAAGRLGAWVQVRPARWDWLPGSVLVEQAGGTAAALDGDPGWHIAAAQGCTPSSPTGLGTDRPSARGDAGGRAAPPQRRLPP